MVVEVWSLLKVLIEEFAQPSNSDFGLTWASWVGCNKFEGNMIALTIGNTYHKWSEHPKSPHFTPRPGLSIRLGWVSGAFGSTENNLFFLPAIVGLSPCANSLYGKVFWPCWCLRISPHPLSLYHTFSNDNTSTATRQKCSRDTSVSDESPERKKNKKVKPSCGGWTWHH